MKWNFPNLLPDFLNQRDQRVPGICLSHKTAFPTLQANRMHSKCQNIRAWASIDLKNPKNNKNKSDRESPVPVLEIRDLSRSLSSKGTPNWGRHRAWQKYELITSLPRNWKESKAVRRSRIETWARLSEWHVEVTRLKIIMPGLGFCGLRRIIDVSSSLGDIKFCFSLWDYRGIPWTSIELVFL